MSEDAKVKQQENWHVMVCGLTLAEPQYELGPDIQIQKLVTPLSIFDLAAAGAVGFREWAVLEPLAGTATAEIMSPMQSSLPGYDGLNRCWLASTLLILRGFARHVCPAVSEYSWNFIAGHQAQTAETFKNQLAREGVKKAVFKPRGSLPPFKGGLLEFHLKLLVPRETKTNALNASEAKWCSDNFERFNKLAAESERFKFALEAAVDWRYAKDPRAALSRIWAGIESLFGVTSELIYRISIYASVVLAIPGDERISAFKKVKNLYNVRSKAVHGEPIDEDKLFHALHESFEILRILLLDAVSRGRIRSEEELLTELFGNQL